MTQRMTLISSPLFVRETQLNSISRLSQLFDNGNPVCLEIGCGIGDFMEQLAARQPHCNFVAIDIFNRGCYQTCSRMEGAGLQNVRVIRAEARQLLYQHCPADSLQAIYINCPDPWPKKRHRKRRLLSREFLDLALYCLRPGGELHFATDFDDYGESAGLLLNEDSRLENRHDTPHTTDLGDYPVSKYMRRFLDLGQPIYYCRYTKKSGLALPKPPMFKGFRLQWVNEESACAG